MNATSAQPLCRNCHVKVGHHECQSCSNLVCKNCIEYLEEDRFVYAIDKPKIAELSKFCPQCFQDVATPEIQKYEEILERAKQVSYLPKALKTFLKVIKAAKKEVIIQKCPDKKILILQMAYLAAEAGFNSLTKAEITTEKTGDSRYQKTLWSGRALPAIIDKTRLELEEYREEVWRSGN